jgi:hypothetical protein
MAIRAQQGAASPADVFVPILLATCFGLLTGIVAVSIIQRINLFHPVVLAYLAGLALMVTGIIWYFRSLPPDQINTVSTAVGSFLIFAIIVSFVGLALYRRINAYDAFIEGAKEGFPVAIRGIPGFRGTGIRGAGIGVRHWRVGHQHRLCACPARCPDGAFERQRGPGHDGGRTYRLWR